MGLVILYAVVLAASVYYLLLCVQIDLECYPGTVKVVSYSIPGHQTPSPGLPRVSCLGNA